MQVDYHPTAANTELAIWEAKKSMGVLNIASALKTGQIEMGFAHKLRKNATGAAKPETLLQRVRRQQAVEAAEAAAAVAEEGSPDVTAGALAPAPAPVPAPVPVPVPVPAPALLGEGGSGGGGSGNAALKARAGRERESAPRGGMVPRGGEAHAALPAAAAEATKDAAAADAAADEAFRRLLTGAPLTSVAAGAIEDALPAVSAAAASAEPEELELSTLNMLSRLVTGGPASDEKASPPGAAREADEADEAAARRASLGAQLRQQSEARRSPEGHRRRHRKKKHAPGESSDAVSGAISDAISGTISGAQRADPAVQLGEIEISAASIEKTFYGTTEMTEATEAVGSAPPPERASSCVAPPATSTWPSSGPSGREAETESDQSFGAADGAKAAAPKAVPGAADATRGQAPTSSDAAKESRSALLAEPSGRQGKPGKPPGWRSAANTVAVAQRMQAATKDKALERMQVGTDAKLPVRTYYDSELTVMLNLSLAGRRRRQAQLLLGQPLPCTDCAGARRRCRREPVIARAQTAPLCIQAFTLCKSRRASQPSTRLRARSARLWQWPLTRMAKTS